MTTTPAPMSTTSAALTSTAIAVVGVHPVTQKIDTMYFGSEAELSEFLTYHSGNVFDLNRSTGEWVAR